MTAKEKAFKYEKGQYICHVYAKISRDDDSAQSLFNIIDTLTKCHEVNWKPLSEDNIVDIDSSETSGESCFHITLVRGHWAVYHHQIKALIQLVRQECNQLSPVSLCLDELRIFSNFEKSKQFLCLASRAAPPMDHGPLTQLKHQLHTCIQRFAQKLTDEDETLETLAHCSLMCRDVDEPDEDQSRKDLIYLTDTCRKSLKEVPICLVKVDKVYVKIGNHEYEIQLDGSD